MFNVNLLNNQSGRYALIAEAILPPLFLFLIGGFFFARKMQENERVTFEGKPSPGAMWLLWFLVTCMWLIGLVIVAMDTLDTLSLCLIGIFSFLAIVASFVSMMFFKLGCNDVNTNQFDFLRFVCFWLHGGNICRHVWIANTK